MINLTQREDQICHLIQEGLSNEQIAKKLFLTEKTIKGFYMSRIYRKFKIDGQKGRERRLMVKLFNELDWK